MFTGLIYEYYVEHHPVLWRVHTICLLDLTMSITSSIIPVLWRVHTRCLLDLTEYYVEHHPRSLASPYKMFAQFGLIFCIIYIFFACLHFEYYTQFCMIVYSWLTVRIYPTFKNIYRCIPSEIILQGRHIYTLTFIRERRMWYSIPTTHFNIKCTSFIVIDTNMVYLNQCITKTIVPVLSVWTWFLLGLKCKK
jgi:hypothetical protein